MSPRHIKGFRLIQVTFNLFWTPSSTFLWHLIQVSLFQISAGTSLRHLKDVGLIQVSFVKSLRRVKLVSLTQVLVGTSLRRLKLVTFIYVPVRRRKDVSNRSIFLTYHQRRRHDVSAWSRTFRLVTTRTKYFVGTRQYVFKASQVAQSLLGTSQYVAMTSQRRRSRLGTSCGVSATCYVGQDHLGVIHLRRPLVGGGWGFIYFKIFWGGGRRVPLVYVITNEKMNCNRKQAKEMERKKKNVKTIQIDNKCVLNR